MMSASGFVLALVLLSLMVANATGQGGGEAGPGDTGSSGGGGGGGGNSKLTLDKFIKYLEDWHDENPTEYQYLTKLLRQGNPEVYKRPSVYLYYNGSTEVSRNDRLDLACYISNKNPLDLRRTLFIDLEIMEPGSTGYRKLNQYSLVFLPFDYRETGKNNVSTKVWPEVESLSQIKSMGAVRLRIKTNDGGSVWTSEKMLNTKQFYGILSLNLTNLPPAVNNASLEGPSRPKYNDPLEYVINVSDPDGDDVAVTLHIFDDKGREKTNETQEIKASGIVSFKASHYGFFEEGDAGKNFTYCYTIDDGIDSLRYPLNNTTNTTSNGTLEGPCIKPKPKIWVERPSVQVVGDDNCYYWQSYNFSMSVRNQEPYSIEMPVTLYVNTPAHPWMAVGTKMVPVSQDASTVYFSVSPFNVLDRGETFSYRFEYGEDDQHGQDSIDGTDGRRLNLRLIRYDILSLEVISNLVALMVILLIGGILLERMMKRGREE